MILIADMEGPDQTAYAWIHAFEWRDPRDNNVGLLSNYELLSKKHLAV